MNTNTQKRIHEHISDSQQLYDPLMKHSHPVRLHQSYGLRQYIGVKARKIKDMVINSPASHLYRLSGFKGSGIESLQGSNFATASLTDYGGLEVFTDRSVTIQRNGSVDTSSDGIVQPDKIIRAEIANNQGINGNLTYLL